MDIVVTIILVTATSFGLHVFTMLHSRLELKITRALIYGFVFISIIRAALALFSGYLLALMLNDMNSTNEFLAPLILFFLSLPLLLMTAAYSYYSYRRGIKLVQKRLDELKEKRKQEAIQNADSDIE